jgi:hypothetical protein
MPEEHPARATTRWPRVVGSIRRAALPAWLLLVAAAVMAPGSVLAATPQGTAGGSVTEPEVSLLSQRSAC